MTYFTRVCTDKNGGEIVSKDTWQYRHGDVKRIKRSAAGVATIRQGDRIQP